MSDKTKKQNKKINIVISDSYGGDYINLIKSVTDINAIFTVSEMLKMLKNGHDIPPVDLIVLTGGGDVNPERYNEAKSKYTSGVNEDRDYNEAEIIYSFPFSVPKLGICRGAQFLTAISGGKLVQHVNNHTETHTIEYLAANERGYKAVNMSSTHHQMMYPYNLGKDDYQLLAWSEFLRSTTYINGKDEEIELPSGFLEPEIVYYPKMNSLAIQGHPEFSTTEEKTKEFVVNLIKTYLNI